MSRYDQPDGEYEPERQEDREIDIFLQVARIEGMALDIEDNLAEIRARNDLYKRLYHNTHVRTEREEA